MADKKVILVVSGEVDVNNAGPAMMKFTKKACNFAGFDNSGMMVEASKVEGASTVAAAGIAKVFEEDGAFVIVELGNADSDGVESTMSQVVDAADRRTLIVLATDTGLFIGGLGINKKIGTVDRQVKAADIIATICYVADLSVPADCIGGILYQALKDPNMKLKEIGKLQDAIGRMEVALQRDNREPWDKHDCA